MDKRLKVGFYGITGCAGCLLSFIFNEDDLLRVIDMIDLRSFPFIKEKIDEDHLDIIFLEGVVANNHDLETLKKLREQCSTLVAMGACATLGGTPALRNFTHPDNFKHLRYHKAIEIADLDPKPVHDYVKVDYYIHGCPPDKKEILRIIADFVAGKKPFMYSKPVCIECRENKNPCLLEMGQPCLGPITRGGCDAICVNNGLVCWGCRGPIRSDRFALMTRILKNKGYNEEFIRKRMQTFEGWQLKNAEEGKAWNEP